MNAGRIAARFSDAGADEALNSTSTLKAAPVAVRRRPTLSVVICAYSMSRWDDLCAAVESACGQLRATDECILVIDHNPELQVRARSAFADIRISPNTGVQGLSGARNTGVALAGNDVVIFLDDDATALPGMIAEMATAMADPSVAAVGGAPRPVWPGGRRPWWFAEEFDWVVGCGYVGLPRQRAEVRNVIGAAMAFRRDVLDEAGPFTAGIGRAGALPPGCEETELCIRVRQRRPSALIYHLPGAQAAHRVSTHRTTWRYFLRRCFNEGVSKAVTRDALTSERSYLTRTLPGGLLRNLGQVVRGRPAAAGKMAAIVLGVVLIAAGYVRTRTARRSVGASPATAFEPVYVGDADIRDEINLPVRGPAGLRYESAEILVRNGIDLVGVVRVPEHRMGQRVAVMDLAGGAEPPARPAVVPPVVGISVVVPTSGRPEQAAECVRSILATGWPALEVLIVDNKPGDAESAAPLRRLAVEHDQVRYVPAQEPGASAARNRGVALATHEIIALTDDDVLVDRHWPAAIALAFEDLTVACVTGLVRPRRLETRAQMLFERGGGFGKGLTGRRYCGDDLVENRGGPLYPYAAGRFGSGNNVAFRRAVLGEVGGYDVRLGPGAPTHAGEDLDLFIRVVQDGYVLLYEPRAVVYHDHRTGEDQLRSQLYGHGCGQSAMLVKQALRRGSLTGLIRRFPHGLRLLFDSRSGRRTYPPRFALAHWRGLATGPLLLLLAGLRKRK